MKYMKRAKTPVIDYSVYEFNKKELLLVVMKGLGIISVVGTLFYQSVYGIILLTPYMLYYVNSERKKKIILRKQILNIGFRDGIRCMLAALEAGYSLENSIGEAVDDLIHMYGTNAEIVLEFTLIQRQVKNSTPIEDALEQFALRTGLEDIESFSEVLKTAKRTGGDFIKIIRITSNAISDKLEVKREITTLITAKQFEVKILRCIPFGIISYLWLFSPGYLSPLYHNMFGVFFMTVMLFMYLLISRLAERITNIDV